MSSLDSCSRSATTITLTRTHPVAFLRVQAQDRVSNDLQREQPELLLQIHSHPSPPPCLQLGGQPVDCALGNGDDVIKDACMAPANCTYLCAGRGQLAAAAFATAPHQTLQGRCPGWAGRGGRRGQGPFHMRAGWSETRAAVRQGP
eukprot:scaffold59130_cov21-Tisochrysis_lutea.AAC.2